MHDIEDNIYLNPETPLWVWIALGLGCVFFVLLVCFIIRKLRAKKPAVALTPFETSLNLLQATAQQLLIQAMSVSAHAISTALRNYLAREIAPESETCTTAELQKIFDHTPELASFAETWIPLLKQCDAIRFGGSMLSQQELSALLTQAENLLRALHEKRSTALAEKETAK